MSRPERQTASKTKRSRFLPGMEALEQRLALAVTADLVGGKLLVVGTAAADVIAVDHSGTTTTVAGKAFKTSPRPAR